MALGYNQIGPGRAYRVTGNTFANKGELRKIGAIFHDDTPEHDAGGYTRPDRYWTLDLRHTSKAAYQKQGVQNAVFHLVRAGVDFEEADDE